MPQFDVYANPIRAALRAYPFIVNLQSTAAGIGADTIVAPLAPRSSLAPVAGRLMPAVSLLGVEYVVVVPALTSLRTRDLVGSTQSLSGSRGELLAAIEYLFHGV